MLKWNNHLLQKKTPFSSRKRCLRQVPKGCVWAAGWAHCTARSAQAPERLWGGNTPSSRTNCRCQRALLQSSSSFPSRELFMVEKVQLNPSKWLPASGPAAHEPGMAARGHLQHPQQIRPSANKLKSLLWLLYSTIPDRQWTLQIYLQWRIFHMLMALKGTLHGNCPFVLKKKKKNKQN